MTEPATVPVPIFCGEDHFCQHCGVDLTDHGNVGHDVRMCGYHQFVDLALTRFDLAARAALLPSTFFTPGPARFKTAADLQQAEEMMRKMIDLGLALEEIAYPSQNEEDRAAVRTGWYEGFRDV